MAKMRSLNVTLAVTGVLCVICAMLIAYLNGFLAFEPAVPPSPFLVKVCWGLTVSGIVLFFAGLLDAYFNWISN